MENLDTLAQESSSPEVEETTQTGTEEHNQQEAQAKSHSGNEENIRQLRQAKEKAEREREEYMLKLKQYEEQQKQSQESAKKEKYRDPSDLAEYQDLIEIRKEIAQQKQAQEQLSTEIKLRQTYPDIDQVLTSENIERFNKEEPELAQMLASQQNTFSKASVVYKYLKKLDSADNMYKKEKDQIASNHAKPRSSASVSKGTPLSQANDFMESSEDRRKRVYQEMQAAIAQNR